MKPLTGEWVAMAEADLGSAQREFQARKKPNYDLACFLSQQCIEKYLKARLQEASTPFGKTHDLEALLNRLKPIEPLWLAFAPVLKKMSGYAVEFRYPGKSASEIEARDAIKWALHVRELARASLGLPSKPRARRRGGSARPKRKPGRK
jgi:HEPN domain-containing protein